MELMPAPGLEEQCWNRHKEESSALIDMWVSFKLYPCYYHMYYSTVKPFRITDPMVNYTTCGKCVTKAKITAFGSWGVHYQNTVMLISSFQVVQLGVIYVPWLSASNCLAF